MSDDYESGSRRSIIITGAATGIGRETARLFAHRGWFVGCFDRNRVALEVLKGELGHKNGVFRELDVRDRSALLKAFTEFAESTNGKVDILFNNAGIDAKGRFETMAWEQILTVVDINLIAGLSAIHAALPFLKATPGSLCLSTSSASAIFGTANLAVYSATKHALRGLTEALSVEFADFGVRAADILPGIIDTGMLSPDEKSLLPKTGMWRVLPAEAVAETVWAAYEGTKLHWYVPAELAEYDLEVTAKPEGARDKRISGLLS